MHALLRVLPQFFPQKKKASGPEEKLSAFLNEHPDVLAHLRARLIIRASKAQKSSNLHTRLFNSGGESVLRDILNGRAKTHGG